MIGVDIVQVSRIKDSYNRFGERFLKKILSEKEINKAKERKEMFPFIAGRFAAREAYVKATGDKSVDFKTLIVDNTEDGKPFFVDKDKIQLSISHEKDYAVAVVLCL